MNRFRNVLSALMVLIASAALGQTLQWPTYGNDSGGTRYSPARQINRSNVAKLKQAWIYHTRALENAGSQISKIAFEATPLFVNNSLYLSTPLNRIIAIDPETGKERWTFDPEVSRDTSYSEVTSRGVSYWADPSRTTGSCATRVIEGTIDARLIAVDAGTGMPCPDFGKIGQVDLANGIRVRDAGNYQVTSPPAVLADTIIVGSSIGDNRAADLERGIVRAFDVRTGSLRWSWDPLAALPKTGAANAWSIMSADARLGLVFIPTGSAAPDFYGGDRKGDNRYANSVTALRISTGEVVWSFQVVHHDLWDYDVASQPVLINYGSTKTPAVVVTTKMGFIFVLDRMTGKPLSPVEERSVPKSDVSGETASPTQPFPTAIEPLVPDRLTAGDAFGLTEADRMWCRDQIALLRSEGIFTPPSLRGSILFPGNIGGVAWGGPAFDPVRSVLIVNTNRLATVVRLVPRDEVAGLRDRLREAGENRLGYEFGSQAGTPYAMIRAPLITPGKLLCNPPPWGALTAIDLTTGKKKWEVPLGDWLGQADGSPNLGGPLVTAGGLAFIGATPDNRFRAFDVESGQMLWESELPAAGHATPMTYIVKGKQYVVISAGGHAKLGSKLGDAVVAYAL
jgi:quinoprotein glucose dehydrogenase